MLDWIVLMGLSAAVDVQAVSNCAALADDRARLACYDALFPPAVADTPGAVAGAAAGAKAAVAGAPAAPSVPQVAAPVVAAPTVPPLATAPVTAAPAAPPAETFGLSAEQQQQRKPEKPAEIESIETRVAAVKALQYDRFRLTLENGQVWSQTEPTPRQQFYPGDVIRIRKAALGSYMATGPKSSGGIRVRREQ